MATAETFTSSLRTSSMTPMEKGLATQILESRILALTVENDKGVVTLLRALIQGETIEYRLDLAKMYADKLFAIHQLPGKYTKEMGAVKWQKMVAPKIKEAFLDVYGSFIQEAGVEDAEIHVKGKTNLTRINELKINY